MEDFKEVKVYKSNDNIPIPYIRISEVDVKIKDDLRKWLIGQTIPWIADIKPMDAVYEWDYNRFIKTLIS